MIRAGLAFFAMSRVFLPGLSYWVDFIFIFMQVP